MRKQLLAIGIWAGLAAAAIAIPYIPAPLPVYDAPIDRALANVEAMPDLEDAQRHILLGRLNLLAYARDDANFTYVRDGDHLNLGGSVLCSQAPRMREPEPDEPEYGPEDRCAQFDFNLAPPAETPEATPAAPSDAALRRLQRARQHYIRAVRLAPSNLRARLGLAYAYDRMNQRNFARRELRALIDRGLPRLRNEHADWDDHVVLTEAAEHMTHLAQTKGEQRRFERLRERLQASRPMIMVTPIVVPLRDAAFDALIAPNAPVAFDFAGTGDTRAQGWLTADAAWLVWDPHGRGEIRSGFDLIGQRSWAVFWRDGFEALRALDDDRDGVLRGAELGGLALWRDANGDGVSDPGEVLPVSAHGIVGLGVRGEETRRDLITAPDGVRFEDGSTRPLYDWIPGLTPRGPVS